KFASRQCLAGFSVEDGIDVVALNEGVERKQTPPPIPALERERSLLLDSLKYIVPFVGNPIFERKCKSLLWPLAHPRGNLRHSIQQNLLPACEPHRGWDSLHCFYEFAIDERHS